jgi:hypothetical protein
MILFLLLGTCYAFYYYPVIHSTHPPHWSFPPIHSQLSLIRIGKTTSLLQTLHIPAEYPIEIQSSECPIQIKPHRPIQPLSLYRRLCPKTIFEPDQTGNVTLGFFTDKWSQALMDPIQYRYQHLYHVSEWRDMNPSLPLIQLFKNTHVGLPDALRQLFVLVHYGAFHTMNSELPSIEHSIQRSGFQPIGPFRFSILAGTVVLFNKKNEALTRIESIAKARLALDWLMRSESCLLDTILRLFHYE